jgi:hypothetical protein
MRTIVTLFLLMLAGCTEQQMARQFGGTASIDLPRGTKLVTVTWKQGDTIWYLVRPMREGEQPEEYGFQESSSFGMVEGTVVLRESR